MIASPVLTSLSTAGLMMVLMAAVAVVETVIPLRARGPWSTRHLGPNLAITILTFATNILMNVPLLMVLAWQQAHGIGLLRLAAWPAPAAAVVGLVMLDLATYLAHTAMHYSPILWRFHSVHHADPMLDVTTAARQHPGESLVRYGFLAVFAMALGVAPAVFAVYRVWSVVSAIVEHANLRLPLRLDNLLSLVVVSPNMHKVHHSRAAHLTNTNYGNLFSIFDRIFATFTPAARGLDVDYGLAGFDDPATQTTASLLALPFSAAVGGAAALTRRTPQATGPGWSGG